ncbi:hypothetical protein [[Phormidium] sp. ETS-05]|uniref:hypothetical protein n=1 Tax=[Phormidium] sp. ETS-05 TaxID=222819 RepID=UPI0018EF0A9D|nr:hypothetical protein [[Phormidium] sp. ETS-05]
MTIIVTPLESILLMFLEFLLLYTIGEKCAVAGQSLPRFPPVGGLKVLALGFVPQPNLRGCCPPSPPSPVPPVSPSPDFYLPISPSPT